MSKGVLTKRWRVLVRDGFKCQYCGRGPKEVKLEVDHRIPRKLGGKSEMSNLITACFDCNRGKSATIDPLLRPELLAEVSRIKPLNSAKPAQKPTVLVPRWANAEKPRRSEPTNSEWAALLKLEPRLSILEREIKAIRPKVGEYCPNDVWYGYSNGGDGYRNRMSALVGYDAKNPAINDELAYMTAYDYLYRYLLPPCPKKCEGCG